MDLESARGDGFERTSTSGPRAWSDVRARDVEELLTQADVTRAGIIPRAVVGLPLVMAAVMHFTALGSRQPTGEPDHTLVIIFVAVVAVCALAPVIVFAIGRRGLMPKMPPLPPPPSGALDHAALEPFLGRDFVWRIRRAASIEAPALAGAIGDFLFVQQHLPMKAPAHVFMWVPIALAALYMLFGGAGRERLAEQVADDISGVAEAAALAGR